MGVICGGEKKAVRMEEGESIHAHWVLKDFRVKHKHLLRLIKKKDRYARERA